MTNGPSPAGSDRAPGEGRRVRGFLVACAFAAMVVGTIGQLVMPAHGNPFLAWLDTAVIPAVATILFVVSRPDRPVVLAITLGLVYVEALLTASLFAIGLAFSIVVPIIGIGLVGPKVRGRTSIAAYIGAWAIATLSVVIAETGNPPNPLGSDVPALTGLAFAIVAAGALGLMWRSSQQQVAALDVADRELAARLAATAELERTAEFLETMVGSSPVATIALDPTGAVMLWSPAATAVFGWSADETVGRPPPAGLAVPDAGAGPSLPDLLARALAGEPIRGERVAARRRDGSEVTIEVHADARRLIAGQSAGAIVQAIDVTGRLELEARLRRSQRLEAVGHLAGGIAHDINNALTAVGGFTEMIESAVADPTIKEDARTVVAGVQRASLLTRRLLAFAQRSVLQPRVIDAATLVEAIRPDLERTLGPDIALAIRGDGRPALVHVDPGQFGQALLSLAEHAREAMPGGGTLSIAISRDGPPPSADGRDEAGGPVAGGQVVIDVADTGGPVGPDAAERAFEPYALPDEGGQVGSLGLAMVHGFVTQSGGEVSLGSTSGIGTNVRIRLPDAGPLAGTDDGVLASTDDGRAATDDRPARPDDGRPRAGEDRSDAAAPGEGRETILVIDDEPSVREFCRRVLTRLGYRVLTAADGPAGIELASGHRGPIALVLTDVIMPGMAGPEAVARIAARHPEAATLYASGYTADAMTERGVLPDGIDLIAKPFTIAALGERVRAALDRRADAGADEA